MARDRGGEDSTDGFDALDALVAPEGQEVLAALARTGVTPESEPALAARLRRAHPAELVIAALAQHELRVRARAKFTRADRMFFTRDGLEQASAERIARHRATRFAGAGRVADLCCGIGGDLAALAAASAVHAVDRDPLHLRMARLNAAAYGVDDAVDTECADVRDADLHGVDAVFVDPARRADGRRRRAGDSEPPLSWCTALADRVAAVAVKASPAVPREVVPRGWELEFVADGRELKEATLWSPAFAATSARATLLPGGDVLLPVPGEPVQVREPGAYLLDPNPAVTRAGLVADLARLLGAWQVDPSIAFLSTDAPVRTPFARTLRVLDSTPWRQKELRTRLRALDVGSVDVRRRGLAGDVEAVRRGLRLTGSRRATLVMTRVADRPWALVCVDA
ncbi:MAG TPA: class I SAM-dependent methyltransferase [Streptosporangiales bacterium]